MWWLTKYNLLPKSMNNDMNSGCDPKSFDLIEVELQIYLNIIF